MCVCVCYVFNDLELANIGMRIDASESLDTNDARLCNVSLNAANKKSFELHNNWYRFSEIYLRRRT